MNKVVLVLITSTLLALSACSAPLSQDEIREAAGLLLTEQVLAEVSRSTATSLPPATFTLGPSPTPAPVQFSIDELRSLSLQASDLQPGYMSAQEFVLDVDTLRSGGAIMAANYLESVQPFTGLDLLYPKSAESDFTNVRSRIVVFSSEEIASDYLEIHPTLFGVSVEFQPLSYIEVGDETKAFFAQSPAQISQDLYFVTMRKRNVVVAVNYIALAGSTDLEELEQYVRILGTRLDQAIP
ncbi:MAG: hypothetical protein KIS85_05265 [Anaerolineales bacterium]|nr:hypothetical protein [Anaerolineales bacterium]